MQTVALLSVLVGRSHFFSADDDDASFAQATLQPVPHPLQPQTMSSTPTQNRSRFAIGSAMHSFTESLDGRVLFAIPKKGASSPLSPPCPSLRPPELPLNANTDMDACPDP